MEIEYALEKYGWTRLVFTHEQTSVTIIASYLTDVLGDLVRSALYLASYGREVKTVFDTEDTEYSLIVENIDSNLVKITVSTQSGKDIIDATCGHLEYLTKIQSIAHEVLKNHGAEGYKRKWVEHDFPLIELKLLDKKILRLQRIRSSDVSYTLK